MKPLLTRLKFWNLNLNHFKVVEAMRLQIIGIEVPLNGIASLPNFMKIYQTVQKLVEGDRQTDWCYDKPTFIFGK
jgi:hypothetical protein